MSMERNRSMDGNGKGAVVITGASSGIGQATARAFAREGAKLVLAARDRKALERVAAECRAQGAAEVLTAPTDVTDAKAVRDLAERARAFSGTVAVWVSNVGTSAVGRFQETPMATHEQVVRANLIGHMNDAHAVLPIFLRQGFGTFINMISLGAFAPAPFAAAYSASKYGLKGFSESLRAELADKPSIHVCDVYPAFVDTPGIAHGANYSGRALTAPPPVYDARRVARAIVDLAERPRPTTIVGSVAWLARLGHLLAPGLVGRFTAWFMAAYFRRADPAPRTHGTVFAPPRRPGGIDGGLRQRHRMHGAVALGLVALAALAAGSLLGGRSSPRS